jgi:MerR family transcriptional regulator, copper efflux regulator
VTIGELAQSTGCSVPTIRYYEEVGLLPQAKRRQSGHRFYEPSTGELLKFIRRCQEFGFPIETVRQLAALAGSEARDCIETRDIAQAHLDAVHVKRVELQALERNLSRFVKSCSQLCVGGPADQCTIIKDLGSARTPSTANTACCG